MGKFLQRVELMGGLMWWRSRSSESGYPQVHLLDSEETQSYDSKLYSTIFENNKSLKEVTQALERAGPKSPKLIVGIDFTKFNDWAGQKSFNNRSLHHIGSSPNTYQQTISTLEKTLADFYEDNFIQCFGFGDATTHDNGVFSLCPDGRHCNGFKELLTAYKEKVPSLRLAGPTSFAPIIKMAMSIVEKSGGQFHTLVIVTSGQLGLQKQKTMDAIVEASKFPLSITIVGVGDGPWDIVKSLGDSTPSQAFDNVHFVKFADIMTKNVPPSQKEAEFAQAVLMKVHSQYKATRNFFISGIGSGRNAIFPSGSPLTRESSSGPTAPPPAASSTDENEDCPICYAKVNMVLYCGHQICSECKPEVYHCPLCRIPVGTKDYKLI